MNEYKAGYSFICDYAFTGANRKVGAIGIFQRILKDFVVPTWFIVTNFKCNDTEELKLKVALRKDGKIINENFLGKELPLKQALLIEEGTTIIVQLPNMHKFSEHGEYSLETYINGNLVGQAKFQVVNTL